MSSVPTTPKQFEELLKSLRDVPTNTGGANDKILGPLWGFVMKAQPHDSDKLSHWFCSRADPIIAEAAVFMIRLFAYSNPKVDQWKEKMASLLASCPACVKGLQDAKLSSRQTYFAAFQAAVLENFWKTFADWEREIILQALSKAKIGPESDTRTIADAPPAVLYHILSNPMILEHEDIRPFFTHLSPSSQPPEMPVSPPPVGLLYLLVDLEEGARAWARAQLRRSQQVPISLRDFDERYKLVMGKMVRAVEQATTTEDLHVSSDLAALWFGFAEGIRYVPVEYLTSTEDVGFNLRRVVTGHLYDTGSHFEHVLRSLMFLLRRLKSTFWDGQDLAFPQIVFDAVTDNDAYLHMLHTATKDSWSLRWFDEYLKTFVSLPVWGEVLAKLVNLLCDEARHERFKDVRPQFMLTAAKLLQDVMKQADTKDADPRQEAVSSALSVHKDILVAVAFGRAHDTENWKEARCATRALVKNVFMKDTLLVADCTSKLCHLIYQDGPVIESPTIHEQLWKTVYESVHAQDDDAVAMLVAIARGLAHADGLTISAFTPAFKRSKDARKVFDTINHDLEVFRRGFRDAVVRFADGNRASKVASMLRRPALIKELVALLMSPLEDLQVAAQALVSQAFDVDGRLDCFRALLEHLPNETFEGICTALSTFVAYAPGIPEACSSSKSLVRCLTDVIDVLCASSDGLLRRGSQYLKGHDGNSGPVSLLPNLWSLMAKASAVIFRRTPAWSSYFSSEEMVIWMRDALIFGRDMLAQRKVIESAIVSAGSNPSTGAKKLSQVGRQMVSDLQQVLPELMRWLRLTDFELLHQSFSLLESLLDCFRATGIAPDKAALDKLAKHVESGRKADPAMAKTKLDAARLTQLEEMLAEFDDEVQIIDVPPPKAEKSVKENKPYKGIKPAKEIRTTVGQPGKPAQTSTANKSYPARASTSHPYHVPGPSKPVVSSSTRFTKDDHKRITEQSGRPKLPQLSKTDDERSRSSTPIAGNKGPGVDPRRDNAKKSRTSDSSSSESSDDEESQGATGLKALQRLQTTPKVKKPMERRQVKMMDDAAVGLKSSIQQRLNRKEDARRTALRLKPDVSPLHRIILNWDYDHQGDGPPNHAPRPRPTHVPDVFDSYEHYRRTFEPLLVLECWAQLVQSKEEPRDQYECKVTSRQFVDDWSDLEFMISDSVKRDWSLSETDVVLLKNQSSNKSILAKVQHYRASPRGIQGSLRCYLGGGRPDPGLQANTVWSISRIFSLSTLHREYAALIGLQYYDFMDDILRPRLVRSVKVDEVDIKRAMATYAVNEPQAQAILGALQTDNFSLIQGPPGTGKTTTICSLVKAFLSKHPRSATIVHPGRSAGSADKSPIPKILICAPSNAAIDEVASRLKDKGSTVVRMGAEKAINVAVKDISLDALVDQKLSDNKVGVEAPKEVGNQVAVLRAELDSVRTLRQQKEDELSQIHDNLEKSKALDDEIRRLKQKRMSLTQQMDKLKDKQRDSWRTLDGIRRRFRSEVLQDADVICSTLSGSGHELLEQFDCFDMVIIDEAAQAIELSSLIPLKYRTKRCVMVGDPQQLPPTVLSQEARKYTYDQSLFVRLQKQRPDAVHLLSIQYRMHPEISSLPSEVFYSRKLLDGPGMAAKTQQLWHTSEMFGPYRFFNVSRGQETSASSGSSLLNRNECQVAAALYNRLQKEFTSVDFDFRVGVVSMYRAQIQELRRTFQARFGADIVNKVDFNTVDGFQGQEKDIIILSCVRATTGGKSVGFLADRRRMNVALTRARSSLFILGHAPTLERSDDTWKGIVNNARTRAHLFEADVEYFSRPFTGQARILAPPKTLKRKASPEADLPDLMKPKDIKVAIARGTSALEVVIKEVETPAPPEPSTSDAGPSTMPMDIDQDNAETVPSVPPCETALPVQNGRPHPPLRKRTKPAASLFVPKKPNKRPLP